MARQIVTDLADNLTSVSALSLGVNFLAVSMWLNLPTFANDGTDVFYWPNATETQYVRVRPNQASGVFECAYRGATGFNGSNINRPLPSSGWHHLIFNLDIANPSGTPEISAVYLDGASAPGFTANAVADNTGNIHVGAVALSGHAGWAFAELAIWGGFNFGAPDVAALWNGGLGADARVVNSGSVNNYWKIAGVASPEPATVGGIDLAVAGTAPVAHPISLGVVPVIQAHYRRRHAA
jgi:hypothetical protein